MLISARALRAAGWALLAYGVLGVLLLMAAVAIGSRSLERADVLLTSLDGTLAAAADTARSSSTALGSVDSGLDAARSGTRDAGVLVAEAAVTSGRLADAMSLSVLGTQPLIRLAGDFRTISDQLSQLGQSLGLVGDALATSTSDLATVRADVERLIAEVESVRDATGTEGGTSLRVAYYAVLAWLTLPAFGALVLGWSLLRLARGILVSPPDA